MTMNKKIANSVLIFRMITICFLTALSAFGCATVPDSSVAAGPRLEPAPLPSYSQGTTFVYADGKWETVIDKSSGIITWKDHRNYAYSGSPDFSHRPSQWQSKTRSVTRQFGPRTDVFIQSATTLWPLRVGNAASYSETGTWVSKGGAESFYQTAWSCAVTGTERVSVMAGDFDTYKIVCKRYSVSKKKKNRTRLREAKTWNYAPAVGHYVLATTTYYSDKKPRRQELLAVLPSFNGLSAGARRQMEESFQQALERNKSGQAVRWSSAKLRASVETMPTKTFKTAEGSYSRRYVQKLTLPDGQRTYYGFAVRNSSGVWKVPRK
jgi:surface antigen